MISNILIFSVDQYFNRNFHLTEVAEQIFGKLIAKDKVRYKILLNLLTFL